jgi:hypothetical protein
MSIEVPLYNCEETLDIRKIFETSSYYLFIVWKNFGPENLMFANFKIIHI